MRLKRTTAASQSPITVDVLREHLRLDNDDTTHDTRLLEVRSAAVSLVESYLNRPLLTQTFELRLNGFPWSEIELPVYPVQSITSVQYVDTSGSTQTWSSSEYTLDNYDDSVRAKVRPVYGEEFPTTRSDYNVVTVTFDAGWSNPASVPQSILRAILLVAGHFFENTEATAPVSIEEVPLGVTALLSPYRNVLF